MNNFKSCFYIFVPLILAFSSGFSFADFESDTTPVDMRDYWPESYYLVQNYRKYNGNIAYRRITKDNDPMDQWASAPAPGEVRFAREDWYPAPGTQTLYFLGSWGMKKMPNGGVWEYTDSWAYAENTCTNWCGGPGVVYNGDGIPHGKPNGHTLGESWYSKYAIGQTRTPNLQTTAPYQNWGVTFGVIRLDEKFNTFTPAYGRKNGVWAAGNGKTYYNVIKMEFSHGIADDASYVDCTNLPPGYTHQSGYTTLWQYIWYAEGIGEIQRNTLFDERSCNGSMISGIGWFDYIDENH